MPTHLKRKLPEGFSYGWDDDTIPTPSLPELPEGFSYGWGDEEETITTPTLFNYKADDFPELPEGFSYWHGRSGVVAKEKPKERGFWGDVTSNIARGVDTAVPAIGVWNVMICQKSLDTDLVYKLSKALFKNNEYLKKIHPSATYTTPENTVKYAMIPLHPGTIKYLEEKGIKVPDNLRP